MRTLAIIAGLLIFVFCGGCVVALHPVGGGFVTMLSVVAAAGGLVLAGIAFNHPKDRPFSSPFRVIIWIVFLIGLVLVLLGLLAAVSLWMEFG